MILTIKKILSKFKNSIEGLLISFKEELSLQIEFFVGIVAIILGIIFKISRTNWIELTIVIVLVIAFELINTAAENLLDLISYKYNINVKKIKDIFAASTLLISIGAFVVGCIIFIPIFINY